jgi:hypothetical protein
MTFQQALNSPRVESFDFDEHLTKLKSEKKQKWLKLFYDKSH